MTPRIAALIGLGALLASCVRDTPHPSGTVASSGPAASGAPSGAPSSVPAKPSPIVITNLASGEFQIEALQPVGVALVATLERRSDDGGWAPIEGLDLGKGYRLVETCADTAAPSCVSLASGKALFPVPWQGFSCSSQCNGTCRANVWEGEGTFRLVVRSCDGATQTTGPAFALPASETAGRPFERWKVTTDVLRADAVRLELPGPKWDAIDPTSTLLAGFAERGAESPLDHETTDALLKALRAPHGFDDDIVKRCAVGHLVGFRVRRSLATTADTKESPEPEVVDVAVDFTCQSKSNTRSRLCSTVARGPDSVL